MELDLELEEMRKNYKQNPINFISLPKPSWLNSDDKLNQVFLKSNAIVQKGQVYYANIVQANEILFNFFPHIDCPAELVFSFDEKVNNNPQILYEISNTLSKYKNMDLDKVPYEFKEFAYAITDEYDRRSFCFSVSLNDTIFENELSNNSVDIFVITNLIFRKFLPKRKLCGSLLPVIAIPGQYDEIIPLPKKYWSKTFKDAWKKGLI